MRALQGALFRLRCSNWFRRIGEKFRYTEREEALRVAMEYAAWHELQGDYLEFGVARGFNLARAYHFARATGLANMRLHAFDSFEGLPQPRGVDVDTSGPSEFAKGDYAAGIAEVKKTLQAARVDMSAFTFTPGWFDASLEHERKAALKIEKAAVVWIDCDLYESTVPVLDFITDLVEEGTVLLFDDWFCFRANPDRGEQRAVREWMAKNPGIKLCDFRPFGWHGFAFIVTRVPSP